MGSRAADSPRNTLFRMERTSPPGTAGPRRRRDTIISVVLLVLSLPAGIAGLVVAVANGYNLGPVLTGRQRVAVLLGAFVASAPALLGIFSARRARRTEQRGALAALVLNTVVAVAVWLMTLIALIV